MQKQRQAEEGHGYSLEPSLPYWNLHCYVFLVSSHLENGLHHLSEADKRVVGLKDELEQLKPEIEDKAKVTGLLN